MSARKYTVEKRDLVEIIKAQKAYKSGDLVTGISIYEDLLRRSPLVVPAIMNLAVLKEYTGKRDEVEGLFRRAVAIDPENEVAHYSLGLAILQNGVSKEGWNNYQWRMRISEKETLQDKFGAPLWQGEPLTGKSVVVWTEQGLGDEILIGTMIKDLMKEDATFTIVCSHRMMAVFGRAFPKCRILNKDVVLSKGSNFGYDYQISLSELGEYLRPDERSFPDWSAYLDYDTELSKTLRKRYKEGSDNLIVGIAWKSNPPNPAHRANKSIPLAEWLGVMSTPNVQFVNLQYGDAAKEAAHLPFIITDHSIDPMTNMDRFVAQVQACDLVISVSSTPVHVAGALGVPVWNIVPQAATPIWYWGRDREDCPWYPTMELFRRNNTMDVMPRIEKKLAELVSDFA